MVEIMRKTYNVTEIAEILGVSRPTAYELASREDFPSIRVGGRRIVVPCDAFERWLQEQVSAPKR